MPLFLFLFLLSRQISRCISKTALWSSHWVHPKWQDWKTVFAVLFIVDRGIVHSMSLNTKEDLGVELLYWMNAGKGKKCSTGTGKLGLENERARSNGCCSIIRILITSSFRSCFSSSIRLCEPICILLLVEAISATILVLMWMPCSNRGSSSFLLFFSSFFFYFKVKRFIL